MLKSRLVFLALIVTSVSGLSEAKDDVVFYSEVGAGFVPSAALKIDPEVGASASDTGMGFSTGLRFGWQVEYIHLQIIYNYAYLNFSDLDSTVQRHNFGAGLGWEWNIPLLTTIDILAGSAKDDDGASMSGGFGIGLGLSYFVSQKFKIDLSYSDLGYEVDDDKYSMSQVTLGVSFPFEIGYPSTWWRTRKTDSTNKIEALENL